MENATSIKSRFISTFSALKHVDFRFYCYGVLTSLVGSLMQETVVAWLAYQQTHSSVTLGSILFAFQFPMLLLGVAGGWAADRLNRRSILLVTQSLALGISATYALLAACGVLQVWHMLVLSSALGIVVAFELPARFAMVPQVVTPEDIGNAFSLDSLMFYSSRVLGPFVGATLLLVTSPFWCFALNAASYCVELCTLTRIKLRPMLAESKPNLKAAFSFCYGTSENRRVFVLVAVLAFFGAYVPLMPVFTHALNGTVATNGWLIGSSEFGAVIGSLALAYWTGVKTHAKMVRKSVALAAAGYAVAITLFVLTSNLWVATVLVVIVGLCLSVALVGSHATIQQRAPDELRGLISTVFWMYSYFSMFALGGFTLGWCIAHVGLQTTIVTAAAACLAAAVYYRLASGAPIGTKAPA